MGEIETRQSQLSQSISSASSAESNYGDVGKEMTRIAIKIEEEPADDVGMIEKNSST